MCKHVRTTEVTTCLVDGTVLLIHQCDMCGKTVPEKRTSQDDLQAEYLDSLAPLAPGQGRRIMAELQEVVNFDDYPDIDRHAQERQLSIAWSKVKEIPLPTTKKKVELNHDKYAVKAKDVKREDDGDALWA